MYQTLDLAKKNQLWEPKTIKSYGVQASTFGRLEKFMWQTTADRLIKVSYITKRAQYQHWSLKTYSIDYWCVQTFIFLLFDINKDNDGSISFDEFV